MKPYPSLSTSKLMQQDSILDFGWKSLGIIEKYVIHSVIFLAATSALLMPIKIKFNYTYCTLLYFGADSRKARNRSNFQNYHTWRIYHENLEHSRTCTFGTYGSNLITPISLYSTFPYLFNKTLQKLIFNRKTLTRQFFDKFFPKYKNLEIIVGLKSKITLFPSINGQTTLIAP